MLCRGSWQKSTISSMGSVGTLTLNFRLCVKLELTSWAWWHRGGHGRGRPTQALLHVLPCRSSALLGPGELLCF